MASWASSGERSTFPIVLSPLSGLSSKTQILHPTLPTLPTPLPTPLPPPKTTTPSVANSLRRPTPNHYQGPNQPPLPGTNPPPGSSAKPQPNHKPQRLVIVLSVRLPLYDSTPLCFGLGLGLGLGCVDHALAPPPFRPTSFASHPHSRQGF